MLQKNLLKARSIAKKMVDSHLPLREEVNIVDIASKLGLDVIAKKLPDGYSGFLKIKTERGNPTIIYNSADDEHRQRFTIAHEIGHFLMHKNANVHIDGRIFFRNSQSSTGTDVREIEANQFAAELLMPSSDLMARYTNLAAHYGEGDLVLKKLSDFYNVSQQAMAITLGKVLS